MPELHGENVMSDFRNSLLRLWSVVLCGWCLAGAGCAVGPSPGVPAVMLPNPLPVPAANADVVWEQLVDVVDDYFRIQREERVQRFADVEVEGRIDTFPVVGATYLEPWRRDSVGPFERTEATLQTIRRRATVRVVPSEQGYLIDLAVFKELEDLQQPEYATAGRATFRYDSSLRRLNEPIGGQPLTKGWIPLGRDLLLEQQMLAALQARLGYLPVAAPATF